MKFEWRKLGAAPLLTTLAVWPMIVYYYLGGFRVLALVSYLICLIIYLSKGQVRHPNKAALLGVALLLLFEFTAGMITFGNPLSHVFSFRLIYGFMIFVLGFAYLEGIEIEKIFLLLAIVTIIEKIMLVVQPGLIFVLPNYDAGVTFSYENAASIVGGVHSFGGNRSVSGVILLAGYVYSIDKPISRRSKACILFASVLCVSGTAMLFTALYLLYLAVDRLRTSKGLMGKAVIFTVLSLSLMVLVPIFFVTTYEDAALDRFSLYYIDFIIDYKAAQIEDYMNSSDLFSFVFGLGTAAFTSGSDELAGYGSRYGDFIALDFFSRYGLLGTMTLFGLLGFAMRRAVALPVMLILLGTLHYHVLFSGPGQVMSALMLAKALQTRRAVRTTCAPVRSAIA